MSHLCRSADLHGIAFLLTFLSWSFSCVPSCNASGMLLSPAHSFAASQVMGPFSPSPPASWRKRSTAEPCHTSLQTYSILHPRHSWHSQHLPQHQRCAPQIRPTGSTACAARTVLSVHLFRTPCHHDLCGQNLVQPESEKSTNLWPSCSYCGLPSPAQRQYKSHLHSDSTCHRISQHTFSPPLLSLLKSASSNFKACLGLVNRLLHRLSLECCAKTTWRAWKCWQKCWQSLVSMGSHRFSFREQIDSKNMLKWLEERCLFLWFKIG